ncbi:hypothetical protein BJV74DRAFT_873149 [Russula compacta]|nr:hypothetical protein BJV74DRAFT_873149 [Russula compacta]
MLLFLTLGILSRRMLMCVSGSQLPSDAMPQTSVHAGIRLSPTFVSKFMVCTLHQQGLLNSSSLPSTNADPSALRQWASSLERGATKIQGSCCAVAAEECIGVCSDFCYPRFPRLI